VSTGHVVTVLGELQPAELGVVLPHEHLFLRLDNWFVPPQTEEERVFASSALSLDNLTSVRYRPYRNWDNIRIEDFDTVLAEVTAYRRAGGGTIVDVTPPAIGRDPVRARMLSERTGVHVVSGCGYYVQTSHPPQVSTMSAEDIEQELVGELEGEIVGTGVRAGVIGEIGTSHPITADERKVLLASAAAQRRTGAPVAIHLSSGADYGHEVLDILEKGGADLAKVALCHLDGRHPIDVAAHLELAARGAFVEYDLFGITEFSEDGLWPPPPFDLERIDAAAAIWEAGYGDRLLLSHDVCTKMQQSAYGGFGFAHLPGHVAPVMRSNGLSQNQIDALLRDNPARWLIWEPRT